MGLLDIAAGAIGGAGEGLGKMGLAAMLKDQEAQIQLERDKRLHESALELQKTGAQLQQQTYTAQKETDIGAAPRLIAAETPGLVSRRREYAAVDTQEKVNEFTQLEPLKRKAAIDTAVEQLKALSTPEMLKAERQIALAKHIIDPSFTLIPNADGTVNTFDTHTGKSAGKVMDTDKTPLIRKDPEELKAATSVINMANTNLRIAEAAYKASQSDITLDPKAKAAAAAEWQGAQAEAKRLSMPAYAVLYAKAGIEDTGKPAAPSSDDPLGLRSKLPAAPNAKPGLIRGTSGSHEPQVSSPSDIQKRISELRTRLSENVNTTLEGKAKDEKELRDLLRKRDARYGTSASDPDMPSMGLLNAR